MEESSGNEVDSDSAADGSNSRDSTNFDQQIESSHASDWSVSTRSSSSSSSSRTPNSFDGELRGQENRSPLGLSEEMEADLANNNDPNNNAVMGNDLPMPDAHAGNHLNHFEPTTSRQNDSRSDNGNSTATTQTVDSDAMRKDIDLISKLMPQFSEDQIREALEDCRDSPSTVQVVLNRFLELQERQEKEKQRQNDSDILEVITPDPNIQNVSSGAKNKAGNGLRSKNRHWRTNTSTLTVDDQASTSGLNNELKQNKNADADEQNSQDSYKPPRKRKLLDLNLETHKMMEEAVSDEKLSRLQTDDDDPLEGSSKNNISPKTKPQPVKKEDRNKIVLHEEHLHGPFNWGEHRPEVQRKRDVIIESSNSSDGSVKSLNKRKDEEPELVEIGSPPVVDLVQPDQAEALELFDSFCNMFPECPKEFLKEKSKDLAGKQAETERFIDELLANGSKPPMDWEARAKANPLGEYIDETTNDSVTKASENNEDVKESEEDRIQNKWNMLQDLFPQIDPEYLYNKIIEHGTEGDALNAWINEGLETKGKNFPSRADYEKRQKEAEMMEKYSREVTAQEILDMYPDPLAYFSDKTRVVSDIYKKHALQQLKKDFRTLVSSVINSTLSKNSGLYYPTFKALQNVKNPSSKRKSRRPDHECSRPAEIDINFLKELQFSRIERQVVLYKEKLIKERKAQIEKARSSGMLEECGCCYNDECLPEDMLPCRAGHLFCKECVARASEVAIGDGKTKLSCLSECNEDFDLWSLQKALKANLFSKWLRKIQLAEIQKAEIEGLENCPFCDFATIIEASPEENRVFSCQNPECGKESCRLCKEISHVPLRCEEVEKDAEVRKRTYIENKMTEALIRKCWSCKKPFLKIEGCNKMTCQCGAKMCYLCRQPVRDYNHFYGQGGQPTASRTCPLWSDNNKVHDSDVARGAIEAKTEIDEKIPGVQLKHDPTQGAPKVNHDPAKDNAGPGVEAIIGHDPMEQARFIEQQRRIEMMIRNERFQDHHARRAQDLPARENNNEPPVMRRMREYLQLQEQQRQAMRDIRREILPYGPMNMQNYHFYQPRHPMPPMPGPQCPLRNARPDVHGFHQAGQNPQPHVNQAAHGHGQQPPPRAHAILPHCPPSVPPQHLPPPVQSVAGPVLHPPPINPIRWVDAPHGMPGGPVPAPRQRTENQNRGRSVLQKKRVNAQRRNPQPQPPQRYEQHPPLQALDPTEVAEILRNNRGNDQNQRELQQQNNQRDVQNQPEGQNIINNDPNFWNNFGRNAQDDNQDEFDFLGNEL